MTNIHAKNSIRISESNGAMPDFFARVLKATLFWGRNQSHIKGKMAPRTMVDVKKKISGPVRPIECLLMLPEHPDYEASQ